MRKLQWLAVAAALALAPLTNAQAANCPAASAWNVSHAAAVAGHVASGHAWDKHAGEYHGTTINSAARFKDLVEKTIKTSGVAMSNGRHKWWDATTKTIVIFNPKDGDCGTAFRPTAGKTYYDNQR